MSAGHGEYLHLRLFLEGVECPVISARVTASVGSAASANIEVPPLDSAASLVPGTVIHLFYNDHVGTLLGEGGGYRLLFYGVLLGVTMSQSGGGSRSCYLTASDQSTILDRTYLFSLTFSSPDEGGTPTVISDRSAFFGTWGQGIGDTLNGPAEVTAAIYQNRKHPTASYPIQPSGVMGGTLSLIEFALGIQGATRGANSYTTVNERRHRFLEQIASDDGKTAAELFSHQEFQDWLTNRLRSLGTVVSISSVLGMVLGYTYHKRIPLPTARYHHGTRKPPTITPPPPVATKSVSPSVVTSGNGALPAIRNNSTAVGLDPANTEGLRPMFRAWLEYLVYRLNQSGVYGVYITSGKRGGTGSPHCYGVAADLAGGGGGGTGFDSRTLDHIWWQKTVGGERKGSDAARDASLLPYSRALWAMRQYPGAKTLSELVGRPLSCGAATQTVKTSTATAVMIGPDETTLGMQGISVRPLSAADVDVLEQSAAFYRAVGHQIHTDPDLSKWFQWGGDFSVIYRRSAPPGYASVIWKGMYGLGADPVHVDFPASGGDYRMPAVWPPARGSVAPATATTTVTAAPTPPPPTAPMSSTVAPAPVGPDSTPAGVTAAGSPQAGQATTASTAPAAPASTSTPNADPAPRQRLLTTLLLPDMWFCPPPMCNLVFPSELNAVQFDRSFFTEATRVELEVNDGLLQVDGGDRINIDAVYYAPQLRDIRDPAGKPVESLVGVGLQTAAQGSDGTPLVMAHERHTGIVPLQSGISNVAFHMAPGSAAPTSAVSGTVGAGLAESTGIADVAEWMFLQARFASRQVSGSGAFMPRLVAGMPMAVYTRPSIRGVRTDRPTHWVGLCTSVTHSVTQAGGTTSFSMSHCRSHRMQSDPDDVFLGRLASASQLAEGGVRTTVISVASAKLPREDYAFLNRVLDAYFPSLSPLPALQAVGVGSAWWPSSGIPSDTPLRITPPSGFTGPTGLPVASIVVYPLSSTDRAQAKARWMVNSADGSEPEPGVVYYVGQISGGGMEDVYVKFSTGELGAERTATGDDEGATEAVTTVDTASMASPDRAAEAKAAHEQAVKERRVGYPFDKIEVTEVTGGVRSPLEEAVRPPWMDEAYMNDKIGSSIYEPLIGCGSVIDHVQGRPLPLDLTTHDTEHALDTILSEYVAASSGGHDAPQWIHHTTYREIATLSQVLGKEAVPGDPEKVEGFHFYTSGDYAKLEHLDLAKKTGLLNPWTSTPVYTPIPEALDPRADARAAVLRYVGQVLATRGFRG